MVATCWETRMGPSEARARGCRGGGGGCGGSWWTVGPYWVPLAIFVGT